jgi:hypothetical protein
VVSAVTRTGSVAGATIVRQANTPDANNARFYPDTSLPGITVTDPANGGGTYTIYPFNKDNPLAGDPTAESSLGYIMRYAQWLVNDVGVDGLRIDAARHVPYGQGGDAYNPQTLNVPALVMIPSGDRIVPPLSAAALADPKRGFRVVTRLDLPLGHIGMVVSGRARDLCWTPLIDWLSNIPSKRS